MKNIYLIGLLLFFLSTSFFSCKENNASTLFTDLDYNTDTLALAYYHLGRNYAKLNNDSAAFLCYMRAKDEALKDGNVDLLADIYNRVGFIHLLQDLPEEALSELQIAYRFADGKPGLHYYRTEILRNMARAYQLRSILMPGRKDRQDMDSAIMMFEKALDVTTDKTSEKVISSVRRELASIYTDRKDFQKALIYLGAESDSCVPSVLFSIKADMYKRMGMLDSACYYLRQCLPASEIYFKRSVFYRLFEMEKQKGDMKQAVVYADSFLILHDSITKFVIPEKIAEIQQKYESEKLRSEKAELKLKNERSKFTLFVVLVCFVLLLVGSYILIQRLRAKQRTLKIKMLEKENELLLNKETIDSLKKQILENQERIKQLYVERDASYLSEVSDIALKLQEYKEMNGALGKCLFQKMPISKLIPAFQMKKKNVTELSAEEKDALIEAVDLAYPDFSARLVAGFGKFSQTNLCICCLLKLEVSARNIQRLCALEEDNYYKSRQRLAVKLGLDNTKSLDSFLIEF